MQNEGFMKNVFGFIFYPLSLEKRQFSSQFFFGSKRFFLSISITFLKKRKKIYTFANFHTHTHIIMKFINTSHKHAAYIIFNAFHWKLIPWTLLPIRHTFEIPPLHFRNSIVFFSCFFFPVFFLYFFISFMPNQEFHFSLTIIIQLFLVKCHTCVCRLTFDKNIVCHLEVFCS